MALLITWAILLVDVLPGNLHYFKMLVLLVGAVGILKKLRALIIFKPLSF